MALAVLLDEPRAWTHVVELWLWATRHAPDGDLSGLSSPVIARCAGWRGDGDRFVDAMRQAGFLDGSVIHNWMLHNGAHQKKAAADKARNGRRAGGSVVNKNNLTSESPVSRVSLTSVEIESIEIESTKNLAPPENPASADDKEKSFTLAVEPSKPKRGRPPKDPEAHAAERADADRWMARVRDITGLGEDIMCWSQGHFLAWKALRKKHGIETLMLALNGLESDKFYKRGNLGLFVSANAVQSGVAAAQQRRAYRGQDINENWERIEREQAGKAVDTDGW
jgi:hypothetical protein